MARDMDGGLRRRMQLVQGLQWLRAAQGDPFAALLRGHAEDLDALNERLLSREHIWLSDTGTWVAARYEAAAAVLANPAFEVGLTDWRPAGIPVLPPLDLGDQVPELDTSRIHAQALDRHDGAFDLAPVAAEIAVEALAAVLGLTDAERDRVAANVFATRAEDSLLCPQGIEPTGRMLDAVADLRTFLPDEHLLLAVVGVRVATDLVLSALTLSSVDEALRLDPPVRVQLAVAREDTGEVPAGGQVAILLEAANREAGDRPALLPAGPVGQVLPFARATAEAALARGVTITGPAVRRLRAPVSRGMATLPGSRS